MYDFLSTGLGVINPDKPQVHKQVTIDNYIVYLIHTMYLKSMADLDQLRKQNEKKRSTKGTEDVKSDVFDTITAELVQ